MFYDFLSIIFILWLISIDLNFNLSYQFQTQEFSIIQCISIECKFYLLNIEYHSVNTIVLTFIHDRVFINSPFIFNVYTLLYCMGRYLELELYERSKFKHLRNYQTVFQNDCTIYIPISIYEITYLTLDIVFLLLAFLKSV